MAVSRKKLLVNWFYTSELPDHVFRFDDLLVNAAEEAIFNDAVKAESFASSNANRYWNYLLEALDADKAAGRLPLCNVVDYRSRRLITSQTHLKTKGSKHYDRLSSRVSYRPLLLRSINSYDSRLYEAFSCLSCYANGASKVFLTPPGNEDGIDFFALFHSRSRVGNLTRFESLRVVGQAKKYISPVSIDKVREFRSVMDDIRHRALHVTEHVPSAFYSHEGPIVGWITGHSGFQSGALERARESGILLYDSRSLVEMVILSNLVAPNEAPTQISDFVKSQCRLIEKYSTWPH